MQRCSFKFFNKISMTIIVSSLGGEVRVHSLKVIDFSGDKYKYIGVLSSFSYII